MAAVPRLVLARCLAGLAAAVTFASVARASEVRVAVATNFAEVVEKIRPGFEARTGHRLTLTTGSTAKLYAQIRNGAPLDVLLAADAQTPQRLVAQGEAIAGSRFTFALGRLALWSATPGLVGVDGAVTLRGGGFRHLAIANPDLAPFGAAARETLRALNAWEALQPKIVYAQNVGHAYSMVASGNAELGLIALSQLSGVGAAMGGSSWLVPSALHGVIRQDAVLLERGRDHAGAIAFMAELKSAHVRETIKTFGYMLE